MRIRLRPYHPTWVVAFFGAGGMKEGFNKRGFDYVLDLIRRHPEIEVELVEEYDDICERCDRRVPDKNGSVWGREHTCPSAQKPETVSSVRTANRQVLDVLGLEFGSVIPLRELVTLLRERIPDLAGSGIPEIGDAKYQKDYEKGLESMSALWRVAR